MDVAALGWIGEHAPTAAEMERAVDYALAAHSAWDSLHHFMILAAHSATGRVSPIKIAAIDTRLHPARYPQIMTQVVLEHLRQLDPAGDRVTVGCLLQIEASVVTHGPADPLTAGEQAAIERREMHTLARQQETAIVYGADIGGRMWSATKRRGVGGDPDSTEPAAMVTGHSGKLAVALRNCADLIAPAYVAAARAHWARPKGRG